MVFEMEGHLGVGSMILVVRWQCHAWNGRMHSDKLGNRSPKHYDFSRFDEQRQLAV
jgi:hypothetical protein